MIPVDLILKQCSKCFDVKPIDQFNKRRDIAIGRTSHCKSCRKTSRSKVSEEKAQYDRSYRKNNAEKISTYQVEYQINNADAIRKQKRDYKTKHKDKFNALDRERDLTVHGRARKIFNSAKRSAPLRGLSFNICFEQVLIMLSIGTCAKSGIKFNLAPVSSRTNPFGPSLDRIDNDRGYEFNNIQLVCNMFNFGKGDNRELDFIALCVAIADRYRGDPQVIERLKELI